MPGSADEGATTVCQAIDASPLDQRAKPDTSDFPRGRIMFRIDRTAFEFDERSNKAARWVGFADSGGITMQACGCFSKASGARFQIPAFTRVKSSLGFDATPMLPHSAYAPRKLTTSKRWSEVCETLASGSGARRRRANTAGQANTLCFHSGRSQLQTPAR